MADTPRVAVVSGASSGIGRSTALALAARGWTVHAGVRREVDAAALREADGRLLPLTLDVADADSVRAAAEQVGEPLHALVNNAGISIPVPLEIVPEASWRQQMEVNVHGVLRCVQAFLPALRSGRGRILNVSSLAGRVGFPVLGPYAASKHALEGLSDALRLELRAQGVAVGVVQPGAVQTRIWQKSAAEAKRIAETVSDAQRKLYGELIQAVGRSSRDSEARAIPAEACAAVIVRALTARRMRSRYVVGRGARLMLTLRRLLPDRVFDRLLMRGIGLR